MTVISCEIFPASSFFSFLFLTNQKPVGTIFPGKIPKGLYMNLLMVKKNFIVGFYLQYRKMVKESILFSVSRIVLENQAG